MGIHVLRFSFCMNEVNYSLTIFCSGIISRPSLTWKTTPMMRRTTIQQPGLKMIRMMDAKDKILSSQTLKTLQIYSESTNPGFIIIHSINQGIGDLPAV